jgi:hypothetical protein
MRPRSDLTRLRTDIALVAPENCAREHRDAIWKRIVSAISDDSFKGPDGIIHKWQVHHCPAYQILTL